MSTKTPQMPRRKSRILRAALYDGPDIRRRRIARQVREQLHNEGHTDFRIPAEFKYTAKERRRLLTYHGDNPATLRRKRRLLNYLAITRTYTKLELSALVENAEFMYDVQKEVNRAIEEILFPCLDNPPQFVANFPIYLLPYSGHCASITRIKREAGRQHAGYGDDAVAEEMYAMVQSSVSGLYKKADWLYAYGWLCMYDSYDPYGDRED